MLHDQCFGKTVSGRDIDWQLGSGCLDGYLGSTGGGVQMKGGKAAPCRGHGKCKGSEAACAWRGGKTCGWSTEPGEGVAAKVREAEGALTSPEAFGYIIPDVGGAIEGWEEGAGIS